MTRVNHTCMVKSLLAGALISLAGNSSGQTAKWVAPADACAVKNPLEGNTAVLMDARKLYVSLCSPCHGYKGKGDGPAASAIMPHPADHSSALVQSETDGSLFWKLTTGRGPMRSYKTELTEPQRWALVNYIRSLKEPGK
jgi:mono/diheme cytochrome c family protein